MLLRGAIRRAFKSLAAYGGWASGGRRRSEVSEAVFENLRRIDEGAYLYTLAHSKTNHNGKVRAEDVKPVVGSAAAAMDAWLKASGISSGPLFRRINKAGRLGEPASPERPSATS